MFESGPVVTSEFFFPKYIRVEDCKPKPTRGEEIAERWWNTKGAAYNEREMTYTHFLAAIDAARADMKMDAAATVHAYVIGPVGDRLADAIRALCAHKNAGLVEDR
jgi:hypothetical protein